MLESGAVDEAAVDKALDIYWDVYHAEFPQGGDAADHDNAHREGIHAVIEQAAGSRVRTQAALDAVIVWSCGLPMYRMPNGDAKAMPRAVRYAVVDALGNERQTDAFTTKDEQ